MILTLLVVPLLMALVVLLVRDDPTRRRLLLATAAVHGGLTLAAWHFRPKPVLDGWLALDSIGLLFLSITSILFFFTSLYAVGYLGREDGGARTDFVEGLPFANASEAVFIACLLFLLDTMTLVTLCQRFGLLWVAIEATTLASAPLIYFHRHHRSLEATWKYLLICSVGIALALLGNFFLAVAASRPGAEPVPLVVDTLMSHARHLNPVWLKAAFIFFLVGYGTKMGLAPLHTWKPDAYSESPSVVSALLAGALSNCAFVAILRAMQVCVAAGLGPFCRELLLGFGLISMLVAAVFIVGQTDYKRLLAFSSVEHMGILAFGVGIGGGATFGALLHSVNHSLVKGSLFLVAGNILAVYKTKRVAQVRGLRQVLTLSGTLWLLGFLAITGTPPFGTFVSELTIFTAAVQGNYVWFSALYLALLAIIFIGMAQAVLSMTLGLPEGIQDGTAQSLAKPEARLAVWPPLALCLLVLLLGLYLPPGLNQVLHDAARGLGGF